ncbi:AAA family ATPase [Bradyrhizobium jicamae]|uniref:AAA family ATPase n=1 Tax=Bradyrhizobium jicamae TaxID=280332 RepID=A0ABS5FFX0_9BRAD|nr:AAA family ATPase [Bradyrhizobium jicamae]MBR0795673.1 AAA family ATPase [Bradyrhizobium jicamae]
MTDAVHTELAAAVSAIALASDGDRPLVLETEAMRLATLVANHEVAKPDVVDALTSAAIARGMRREDAEHVVGVGILGRSAGVGISPRRQEPTPSRLIPLDIAEFLALDIPPRQFIIDPWLREKQLAQIYSWRGVGKTLLGLSIGYAVATGSNLLGWRIANPRRVLYVDGEMAVPEMQERLAATVAGLSKEPPRKYYFRVLSSDLTEGGLPDLATKEGQRLIDACVRDAELLILDNISTLCRTGLENEAASWVPIQEWALAHRREGRSVLFFHHAGKTGQQRGTSKREDALDVVVALRRPEDYRQDQGARFEWHYEKARSFYGTDAAPFEAQYECRDGAALWTRRPLVSAETGDADRVLAGIREGKSRRAIADELGISKSAVQRVAARFREPQDA